ncbi:sugar transferase [Candidatus Gracilibacteria bacterium]|nr:sugar transferase [Candidatus Gracilibacteria bacterium]
MKRQEIFFSISKVPLDFSVMLGAFFIAGALRREAESFFGVSLEEQIIETDRLFQFAIFGSLLYISVFALHGLYQIRISQSKVEEILSLVRYSIYWFLFFAVGVYLGNGIIYTGGEIPRLIILYAMILGCLGSLGSRILLNSLQSYLTSKKILQKRNLILISDISEKDISPILRDIKRAKVYTITGYIASKKIPKYKIPYLGGAKDFEDNLLKYSCDELHYIHSDFDDVVLYSIWESARIHGVRYRYITNNFDITKTNTTLSLIHKIPVIEILNTPLESWNRVLKRIFDILFSLFGIVIFFPVFIIIAILIKLEDPGGPIIYKNLRIGQGGKLFHCYKFRYMYWKYCIKEGYGVNVEKDPAYLVEKELIASKNTRSGPLYKIHNDPRKTRTGTILEKYSLDEFPQFFNVLFGDMSIVGPRPHQPREVEKYEKYQKRLLTIKPGMTGMAQVHGREKNNFNKEAELDLFYIENWSFLLDFKIILKTLSYILLRK